jgi:Helix-turn-helix domain
MKQIVLTSGQRKEREGRRKKTLDRRIYQRLTAVLALAAGYTPEDVAHLLGVDLAGVRHWLDVFGNDGLETLCTLGESEPSPGNDGHGPKEGERKEPSPGPNLRS